MNTENALNESEQTQREYFEKIFTREKIGLMQATLALTTLRDQELYRSTHPDFESYCQEVLHLSPEYSYLLADSADITNNILNGVHEGECSPIIIDEELSDQPLSVVEETELAYYEDQFQKTLDNFNKALKTFFKVAGDSLRAIREKRLYRRDYASFEIYCRERWNISRSRAHRLIEAATVIDNLLPMGNKDVLKMFPIANKIIGLSPPIGGAMLAIGNRAEQDGKFSPPSDWTTAGTVEPLVPPLPANERQARPLAKLPPEQQREAWQKVVETARDTVITTRHVQQVVDDILHPQPEPEYFYRNQPVKLLEMSYVANGQQYCTIEIVNLYGKKQRQTVQFRHLTTKNSQEKAETGAYDYVQADFDFEALPPEAQVRRVENGALLLFWEWLDEQLPKSEMRTLAGRSRLIQANGKLAGILDGFYEFVERSNENENE